MGGFRKSNFDPFHDEDDHEDDEDDHEDEYDNGENFDHNDDDNHSEDSHERKPQSGRAFDDDPFHSSAGSFGASSADSRGRKKRAGKRTAGGSKSSSDKKDKDRKSKKKSSGKEGGDRSSRQSRSIDLGDGGPKRRNARASSIGRKSRSGAKKKSNKVNRTKSAPLDSMGFDFENPPSFAFPVTTKNDDGFQDATFGDDGFGALAVSSNRDQFPAKESEEEEDFFPQSFPAPSTTMATSSQNRRARPTYSGGLGSGSDHNPRGSSGAAARRSVNNAKTGWMSEMPGFVAPRPPSPPPEEDEDGFTLRVRQGDSGDISPLTAYTKKPVRPMIRGRR